MTKRSAASIHELIERSSFGSADARNARSRVPLAKGRAMAQAAQIRAAQRQNKEKPSRRQG